MQSKCDMGKNDIIALIGIPCLIFGVLLQIIGGVNAITGDLIEGLPFLVIGIVSMYGYMLLACHFTCTKVSNQ